MLAKDPCPNLLRTAEQMFRAARLLLLARYPFYGSLLSHLRPCFTDRVATAAVDARDQVYLNPSFFAALPGVEKRAFILAHEALHPALGIFMRGSGHDRPLSNIAHDFVINLILRDDNPGWLPDGMLLDEQYAGMSYEEVYGRLVKALKQGNLLPELAMADVLPEGLPGAEGGGMPPASDGPGERTQLWAARVVAAQLFAQAQGRGSKGMERAAALSRGSTVPWQEKLRGAVSEACGRARTDWTRPHRRSAALELFLPREVFTSCECAVYVDTSGSITRENLETAVREIAAIIETCGGRVRWMQGDDGVLSDEWIGAAPETLTGGGGTSFAPLFERLRDGEPAPCAVVFTDTFGLMPDFMPDCPVIWAVYGDSEEEVMGRAVPFGEIVSVPAYAFAARVL